MTEIVLNPEQKEAVEYTDGPLLIIAGAGTGKTRVISEKIKYLIKRKGIKASEILAVTYTEKGAMEMEERVGEFIDTRIELPHISTFHGLCFYILQNDGLHIGVSTDFKLLSKAEQLLLIYENFDKLQLDYYKPLSNPTSCLKDLLVLFGNLKSENITVDEYQALAELSQHKLKDSTVSEEEMRVLEEEVTKIQEEAKAYENYNQILRDNNVLDYGDIIQFTYELFTKRPNILAKYQNKFKYVLVDEYQDTNIVQNEIIKLISDKHKRLCVVGDDDQSVFHFQGASLDNILNFQEVYQDVKKVVLNRNYRSGQKILDASYDLIKNNNPDRLEDMYDISKKLISDGEDKSEINKVICKSWESELEYIAQNIKDLHKEGLPYKEMAVLFRSHKVGSYLLPIFKNYNIPYYVVEGPGLYEQEEIRAIRNMIKFLANPDDSLSLFDVLKQDYFSINFMLLLQLSNLARSRDVSLWKILNNHIKDLKNSNSDNMSLFDMDLEDDISEGLFTTVDKLKELIAMQAQNSAVHMMYEFLYGKFNYINYIEEKYKDTLSEKEQKIANLSKFYRRVEKFEYSSTDRSLASFDRMLDIFIEAGEDPDQEAVNIDADAVSLLSIHKSKGLEFDTVFLMGLAQRKFPTANRSAKIAIPKELINSTPNTSAKHKQEERRLMYVAMTRAKRKLFLLTSKLSPGSVNEVKPSVFFDEVPDIYCNKIEYTSTNPDKISEIFLVETDKGIDDINKNSLAIVKKIHNLSYSNIASYRKCPMQFVYQAIYKIPSEPKPYFKFGQYIHRMLEELHKYIKQGKILTEEEFISMYNKKWNLSTVGFESEEHKAEYKKEGERILRSYYKDNKDIWKESLYLEKRFSFFSSNNIKIKGVIDRVDKLEAEDECEIIDYKTGKPKDMKYFKRDKDNCLQLYIYAIACQDQLNINPTKLTFYYLSDGSKIQLEPTPEDLSYAQEVIDDTSKKIKEGLFEADPSEFKCKYCEFNRICKFSAKKL